MMKIMMNISKVLSVVLVVSTPLTTIPIAAFGGNSDGHGSTIANTDYINLAQNISPENYSIPNTDTYNPNEISAVSDLSKFTLVKEKRTRTIADTGITVLENAPGIIRFIVDKPIPVDKSWSGILNVITFKAAVSGNVELHFYVN